MKVSEKKFEIKWAELDANRHLRHSAYYDLGAQMRIDIFAKIGLTLDKMAQLNIGPILFREEAIFLREVGMQDSIKLNCKLAKARKDGSRWSFVHEMYRSDGVKSAIITADGAWMDTVKRKLTTPPKEFMDVFLTIDRTDDFEWI